VGARLKPGPPELALQRFTYEEAWPICRLNQLRKEAVNSSEMEPADLGNQEAAEAQFVNHASDRGEKCIRDYLSLRCGARRRHG
jgi:hypothetical protein